MKRLRQSRKNVIGGLATIGVVSVALLFVVLPALATSAGAQIPPPSIGKNVTPVDEPTGGQSNDCVFFYGPSGFTKAGFGQPTYQYRIANPKTGQYKTTVNGTQVTFTLTMNPPNPPPGHASLPAYANQKYISFTSTGAAIVDVGIKGGTDEARYNYDNAVTGLNNTSYGSVASDTYLHAPAQATVSDNDLTPTTLYSISNLTFCFELGSTASGTVYQDNGPFPNGSRDAGEPGLQGWTVNLYAGQNLAATTTSTADGSYSFTVPQSNTAYTICEAPPPPPPSGWVQTQPAPGTPNICAHNGTTELLKGQTFTATASAANLDFGNVSGGISCPPQPLGIPNYQIQLAVCKPNQLFVFSSTPGVIDGDPNTPPPVVSVLAADQTQAPVPLVEKITFPFTIKAAGTHQPQITLMYDDTFPYTIAGASEMPFCKVDPRNGTEFGLMAPYNDDTHLHDVVPAGATSCLIMQSQAADTNPAGYPTGIYTAYVYSDIDSLRFGTP